MRRKVLILVCVVVVVVTAWILLYLYNQPKGGPMSPETVLNNATTNVSASETTDAPESWKEYAYPGFRIKFPEEPHLTNGVSGTMICRAGQADGTQYFITASMAPTISEQADGLKFLEGLVGETTRSVNGTLQLALNMSNQTGHDSIDFTINIPDGPRTYAARDILIGVTLYQMRVVFTNDSSENAFYKEFFDSFKNK
jgi:hypothetical protein